MAVWVAPKAPRGMPEAVAVDPESINPNASMATPFSPDLIFLGPRFGLAKALEPEAQKIESGLNGAARPRQGLILIPLTPGGSPCLWTAPQAQKNSKWQQIVDFLWFSMLFCDFLGPLGPLGPRATLVALFGALGPRAA